MAHSLPLGSAIQWSADYELGLSEIDLQHQALVKLLGDAWRAVVRNDREQALHLIRRLEHYTVVHFAEEEAFMRSIGFPELSAHKLRHDAFTRRIAEEAYKLESGGDLSLDLFHFLRDWLLRHILVEDRKYADFEAQQQTRSPSLLASFFRLFRA